MQSRFAQHYGDCFLKACHRFSINSAIDKSYAYIYKRDSFTFYIGKTARSDKGTCVLHNCLCNVTLVGAYHSSERICFSQPRFVSCLFSQLLHYLRSFKGGCWVTSSVQKTNALKKARESQIGVGATFYFGKRSHR